MSRQEVKRSRGSILVVEDDDVARRLLHELLGDAGYAVQDVESGERALQALEREPYDVVLLDMHLRGMNGISVLAAAPAIQTDAEFIVMTAFGSVDNAVEAMRLGAFDYIAKPLRPEELLLVIDRARQAAALRREVASLRRRVGDGIRAAIVGRSPAIERVFDLIERVAPTRATVLITGETGTGKELVARAVHDLSDRARNPFVPVNCSALPESLLESELFGHVKGSFTGAIANRRGLFEEAAGGTLFLDEISTMPESIQIRLLRTLQERTVQRIGGGRPVHVDFRLIAATNRDLEAEVAAGRFREDLYYRLNVFPVHVPPLRERRADIPLLASHFRQRFAQVNGIAAPDFSAGALARMAEYAWPGNVRELENYIERAVIMHAGGRAIPFDPPASASPHRSETTFLGEARDRRWSMARLEREYILEILQEAGGHRGRTAEILGIDRRTLYRKLKQYARETRADAG